MTEAWYLWHISSPGNIFSVKQFVAKVDPILETYYTKNGHYPRSLSELNLGSIPLGVSYQRAVPPNDEFRAETTHAEGYLIRFGDMYYRGFGRWEIGIY
jgi:hypothetical protein